MGLTTSSRKNNPTTETPTRITQDISALGRERFSLRRRMTPFGESRRILEATRSTTHLAIRAINVGTGNIRTTYEKGKTTQATRNEELELIADWNQRDTMNSIRIFKAEFDGDAAVLRP